MSELRTNRIVPRDGLPSGSAGGIIQVKQTVKTDTFTSSSTSYTDITGLSVSITPTRSDSKILVMLTMGGLSSNGNGQRYGVALRRDSTNIGVNSDGANHTRANWTYYGRNFGNTPDTFAVFNHLCFYDHKSLNYLAKKTGFKIIKIDYFGLDIKDYLQMLESKNKNIKFNKILNNLSNTLQSVLDDCSLSNSMRIIFKKL